MFEIQQVSELDSFSGGVQREAHLKDNFTICQPELFPAF